MLGGVLAFWKRTGKRWAIALVVLQILLQLAFVLLLAVGERTRLGFLALYAPRLPFVLVAFVAAALAALARQRILTGVQIALCVLLLVPVSGLHVKGEARPTSEKPIRLVSYNVYFGKLGRPQLDEELSLTFPDVLVVQAAYDSLGDRLRKRFPEHVVHQEQELVLVSRFPIREVEVPPLDGDFRPMFVTYVLETPNGPLTVTNVHPYSPRHALTGDEDPSRNIEARETQIELALASARRHGTPFVVAGDTNLPEWSAVARRHFEGLGDAFAEVGFGFGYTFPAKRPWMRIDRVLHGPGVRPVEARVGARGVSDHRMLFVTFEVVSR